MRCSKSCKCGTVVAAVVVVVSLVLALLQRSTSQRHEWKSLHSWLVLLQSANPAEREAAETGVREIGTNAVPTLIAWLSHRDSAAEKKLTQWLAKAGLFPLDRSESYYRSKALCGFRTLGTNAQCAVPDLRGLLDDPALNFYAAVALVWAAPSEAEQVATKWLADTDLLIRAQGLKLKVQLLGASTSSN